MILCLLLLIKISASALAGVVAATVSLPPDNIKTKLMKMKPDANGKLPYKGFIDCMLKVNKIKLKYNDILIILLLEC